MFTESDRANCGFLIRRGESEKYQTCLIFHQASPTLDLDSAHLETILSGG